MPAKSEAMRATATHGFDQRTWQPLAKARLQIHVDTVEPVKYGLSGRQRAVEHDSVRHHDCSAGFATVSHRHHLGHDIERRQTRSDPTEAASACWMPL